MLVATVCLLLYYNALVPSKNYDNDSDELVQRWVEKKLDLLEERKKPGADQPIENKKPPESMKPNAVKPNAVKKAQPEKIAGDSPRRKNETPPVKEPPAKGQIGKKKETAPQPQEKQESNSEWMKRMYKLQADRKAHLRKVCQQVKRPLKSMDELGANPKLLRALVVNDRYKFIYSIVYKVGSTNWERVIVEDLEGFKNVPNQKLYSHKALRWMPGFKPEEATQRLKNYTKFIFVRNPLSRILSAYRDKFVDHHNPVFTKIAKTIIQRFRKAPHNDSAIDVTFPEFMAYLINSTRSNPHWKVVFNQNFPCRLNYDIIGKLEEADDDIPFVLTRIGIRNMTSYGSTPMKKKGSDEELWSRYYSQVPKEVMKRFYEIYKQDFTLFGYEMPTSF